MRKIMIACTGLVCLMALSFRYQNKITLRSDGNYYVPANLSKRISEADAKRLFQLTKAMAASETTVVHETVWTHTNNSLKVNGAVKAKITEAASETTIVHETIYKHKDAKVSREAMKYRAEVQQIMAKYVK